MSQVLKFKDTKVVFQEIPDEISLAINITGCPFLCEDCHSADLRLDIGTVLDTEQLDILIGKNKGVSCILFMGGDRTPGEIDKCANYIKTHYNLKVAWYSGNDSISGISLANFDYIKYGHYDKSLGGLNKESTNQRLIKLQDITSSMYNKNKHYDK